MKKLLLVPLLFVGGESFASPLWKLELPGQQILRAPNHFDRIDPIEDQLGASVPDRIVDLDLAPKSYRADRHPWMHRSWKVHSGMIGGRYLDPKFNSLNSFRARRDYVRSYPLEEIGRLGTQSERDILSPAEKYDLFVGNLDGDLAASMWRYGEKQEKDGGIANWMGLCDGSAGALAMTREPVYNVVVRDAVFGKDLRFFASDIKALASVLYSEFVFVVPIVGGRCNLDKIDELLPGKVPECESLNPALWHRALLHLAGERRDTLFMDHTASREVWNTPIIAFNYNYVNPNTGKKSTQLQEALLPKAALHSDLRRRIRHPDTHSVVAVSMDVYVAGGSTNAINGPQPAKAIKYEYKYDLEIDASGHVIGGEWYSERRPDFIWTLSKDFVPQTDADKAIGVSHWQGGRIPNEWRAPIKAAAAKLQPMGALVRWLIEMSAE